MKYYYWSDTHFNHANIIKYCGRPFDGPDEMNKKLLEALATVPEDAILVHGGDFSMGGATKTASSLEDYCRTAKCRHLFVLGNHDKEDRVAKLDPANHRLILDGDYMVLVIHDPFDTRLPELIEATSPDYVFYGHTHAVAEGLPHNWFHIGVDTNGFKPRTLDEIVNANTANHI